MAKESRVVEAPRFPQAVIAAKSPKRLGDQLEGCESPLVKVYRYTRRAWVSYFY